MSPEKSHLDKTAFSVSSFEEAEHADRQYWWSLTPLERMSALAEMRLINYDHDPASDRIQRVVEIIDWSCLNDK